MRLKAFLKLIRWGKFGPMGLLFPLVSAMLAADVLDVSVVSVLLSVFLIVYYGFALNNRYDTWLDTPEKNPISAGEVTLVEAVAVEIAFLVLIALTTFFLSSVNRVLALALLTIYVTYSIEPVRVKGKPPFDLVWHMLMGGIPVAMGYLTYKPVDVVLLLLFGMSCCFYAVPQLINQINDYEGDMCGGLKTTAIVVGRERSVKLIVVFLAISFSMALPLALMGVVHGIVLAVMPSVYWVAKPCIHAMRTRGYSRLGEVHERGVATGLLALILFLLSKMF
jgi:4-hydroxybenzoate polyprenyltransferase